MNASPVNNNIPVLYLAPALQLIVVLCIFYLALFLWQIKTFCVARWLGLTSTLLLTIQWWTENVNDFAARELFFTW